MRKVASHRIGAILHGFGQPPSSWVQDLKLLQQVTQYMLILRNAQARSEAPFPKGTDLESALRAHLAPRWKWISNRKTSTHYQAALRALAFADAYTAVKGLVLMPYDWRHTDQQDTCPNRRNTCVPRTSEWWFWFSAVCC